MTGFFDRLTLLDFVVLGVILFFMIFCAKRGFVKACFGFLPTWIAIIGTYFCYPTVAAMIRKTPFFATLTKNISGGLHLDTLLSNQAMATQTEIISSMQLPEFLKARLIENNNPVIYELLDVEALQDYIVGFLSRMASNIAAAILVFVVLFVAAKLILWALDLVAHLPVLGGLNHFFGLLVGLLRGVVWVWLAGILLTLFYYADAAKPLVTMLMESGPALWLYENNYLLFLALKIFG